MAMREKVLLNIASNSYKKWYPMNFSRIMLPLLNLHHVFQQILKALLKNKLKKVGIVICHDESTFQANDDESWLWGVKGPHVIRPKSRGAELWFLILSMNIIDIFDLQKKNFQPL